MSTYLVAVKWALILFPAAAFFFTIPYLLRQYRKFGAVPLLRAGVVYSFILYGMTVYFLAILPLPARSAVASMTSARYSLVPLASLFEYFEKHAFSASSAASWGALLSSHAVLELACNLLMFVPLGIYLRYSFRRSAKQTLLCGFLFSLFLELTQLTGLYGLYPRPYRLFDINDLCNNTLGAWIGYAVTPLFVHFLPTMEQLDMLAYRKGRKIPLLRRLFGCAADWLLLGAAAVTVALACGLSGKDGFFLFGFLYYAAAGLYFILGQWLGKGRTPGKRLLRLRVEDARCAGRPARLWQLFVREGLLYGVLLPAPLYCFLLLSRGLSMDTAGHPSLRLFPFLGACAAGAVCLLFCVETLMKLLGSRNEYWFDRLSRTRVVSTVVVPPVLALQESPALPFCSAREAVRRPSARSLPKAAETHSA